MLEMTRVRAIAPLNNDSYSLVLEAPKIAAAARAGQLAHVLCEGFVLRRPFAICDADKDAGTIRLCFEVRGAGTRALAKAKTGDLLSVNGAVGHGFENLAGQKALLVGGGIGIFPLLYAAKVCQNATAALAFRTADRILLKEDFEAYCPVHIATDDGSEGFHGYAADLARALCAEEAFERICACGPMVMMQSVAKVAADAGIPCEVSLEERMGCGVGACLACVCKTVQGTKRVCIDGPVFDSREVRWDA